ncbi:MAG: TatD family hydrolase, partial [Nitrospiraceae bacterium]|nr:TatD family hydrolase [Nitrospiraceae bacterium]
REILPEIPEDRILLETDCPYLAPVPYRGKTNQPAYLPETLRVMPNSPSPLSHCLFPVIEDIIEIKNRQVNDVPPSPGIRKEYGRHQKRVSP